jgi:hypothetical protein
MLTLLVLLPLLLTVAALFVSNWMSGVKDGTSSGCGNQSLYNHELKTSIHMFGRVPAR